MQPKHKNRTDYNGKWFDNPQLCGLLERNKELAWRSRDDYIAACDAELKRLRAARKSTKPHRERKSLFYEFAGFYNRMQPVFTVLILIATVYFFLSGMRPQPAMHNVYLPIVSSQGVSLTSSVHYDYTLLISAVLLNIGVFIYALRHKIKARLRKRSLVTRIRDYNVFKRAKTKL